jgi:threonine synthase
VTTVTDADIMDAKAWIDRIGIGCEPASAASLAGVRRLVAEGQIAADATVVCVLTGNVLKDTDAIAAYHFGDATDANRFANPPVSIPATMDALRRVVDDAIHG